MNQSPWNDLITERRGATPLSEERFRTWMARRRIFVSSVMDDDMGPAREAVRAWVIDWGGEAIMWEEITPRDEHAQHAYLEGVDRSHLFLLLLASRYGVRDASGYSPIQQEEIRAKQRGIPRLVFEQAGLASSQRAGELNDWLRTLHNEVSTGTYADPADLVRKLDRQLREIASNQETPWVKLGRLVIPGTVERHGSREATTYSVRSTLGDSAARNAIAELTRWSQRINADRLTWGIESVPVERVDVETHTVVASEDDVIITCQQSRNWGGMRGLNTVTYTVGGRSIGPAEQVGLWADQALFGSSPPATGQPDILQAWTAPNGPTLPEILAREHARGWLAEGLVRLYLVEGLITRFGGRFARLEVGPATATGVRVDAQFVLAGSERPAAAIRGVVPLA